jgi:hypothetical protein
MTNVTLEISAHLAPGDRFDFHEPAPKPHLSPIKVRVRSVRLIGYTDTVGALTLGYSVSGSRYKASGDPGTRPWSLSATESQLPPHVLDALNAARTAVAP